MPTISKNNYLKILYKAVSKVYYREIIKNTPGKGIVADGWEVMIEENGVSIVNEQFGDIVTFLELGTKPHVINPKKKQALAWGKLLGQAPSGGPAREVVRKKVNHPGIEARKFIQKILENNSLEKEFEKVFTDELIKLLDKNF